LVFVASEFKILFLQFLGTNAFFLAFEDKNDESRTRHMQSEEHYKCAMLQEQPKNASKDELSLQQSGAS